MDESVFEAEWNQMPIQNKINFLEGLILTWKQCQIQATGENLFMLFPTPPDFEDVLLVIPFLLKNQIYVYSKISPDFFRKDIGYKNGLRAYSLVDRMRLYTQIIRRNNDDVFWFDEFDLFVTRHTIFEMLKEIRKTSTVVPMGSKPLDKSDMPAPPVFDRDLLERFLRVKDKD